VYCDGNLPKHHDNNKQPQVEEEKMKARRAMFLVLTYMITMMRK